MIKNYKGSDVICEEKKCSYEIESYKIEIVDGKRIKADTWYELKNGEFSEVLDQ